MTRLLCVIVLVACGGKPSAPAHPKGRDSDLGVPRDTKPEQAQTSSTKERCTKLIEHVVTLAVAERPADQKPTDEERATIVKQLHSAWAPKCDGMTDNGYDCAATARTLVELDRCGG